MLHNQTEKIPLMLQENEEIDWKNAPFRDEGEV